MREDRASFLILRPTRCSAYQHFLFGIIERRNGGVFSRGACRQLGRKLARDTARLIEGRGLEPLQTPTLPGCALHIRSFFWSLIQSSNQKIISFFDARKQGISMLLLIIKSVYIVPANISPSRPRLSQVSPLQHSPMAARAPARRTPSAALKRIPACCREPSSSCSRGSRRTWRQARTRPSWFSLREEEDSIQLRHLVSCCGDGDTHRFEILVWDRSRRSSASAPSDILGPARTPPSLLSLMLWLSFFLHQSVLAAGKGMFPPAKHQS